jgi:CubicO group peptidase (beta-lactamase class C family)
VVTGREGAHVPRGERDQLRALVGEIEAERTVIALLVGGSSRDRALAAAEIARQARTDLHRVDLSTVASRYIGETEKNLAQVLSRAETADVLLFFDEADAIFGKRTETRDANDRYAEAPVHYLLERLEDLDEVVALLGVDRIEDVPPSVRERFTFVIEVGGRPPPPRTAAARGKEPAGDRELEQALDRIAAETDFSGVVRVDHGDTIRLAKAYGLAHRGHGVANTLDTQFGIASGNKPMTALVVERLIEDGRLALTTSARELLGDDLPGIHDDVTVELLLTHRSGIGDHWDEDAGWDTTDYVLTVPVHQLVTTEDYLPVLDGLPPKSAPGERFTYCNAGYVVLALLAERAAGTPFDELVQRLVCEPAGMHDTAFLRSDELPGSAATGYLTTDSPRTNVLHLPVRGTGDGGIYSTVADIRALWVAFFAGRIVPPERVAAMVVPRSEAPEEQMRYGRGFWLHPTTEAAAIVGSDAGVSFHSVHDPRQDLTHTVISNTTEGAWPLARHLKQHLTP